MFLEESVADVPPGLVQREIPATKNPFLRCQLGRYVTEIRSIAGRNEGCQLFWLIGFGSSWAEAVEMIRVRSAPVVQFDGSN